MHRNLSFLPGPPEIQIGVITQGDASCKCWDVSKMKRFFDGSGS